MGVIGTPVESFRVLTQNCWFSWAPESTRAPYALGEGVSFVHPRTRAGPRRAAQPGGTACGEAHSPGWKRQRCSNSEEGKPEVKSTLISGRMALMVCTSSDTVDSSRHQDVGDDQVDDVACGGCAKGLHRILGAQNGKAEHRGGNPQRPPAGRTRRRQAGSSMSALLPEWESAGDP